MLTSVPPSGTSRTSACPPPAPSCRRSTRARRGGRRERRRGRSRGRDRGRTPRSSCRRPRRRRGSDPGSAACLAAFRSASRAAPSTASARSSRAVSPTTTTSTATRWSSSTSSAADAARRRSRLRSLGAHRPRASPAALAPAGARAPTPRADRGALLHQGEGLKDGVVQVRGELRTLLGADALGALRREVATEPPEERREDQAPARPPRPLVRAASRNPPRKSFPERNSNAAPITNSTPKTPL